MGNADQVEVEVERLGVAKSTKLMPATEEGLVAFETAFGHLLPSDYRWFLSRFGGADKWVHVRVPIKTESEYVGGRLRTLFEFTALSDLDLEDMNTEPSWLRNYGIVDELDVNVSEPYATKLVLISRTMYGNVWALDYRHDAINPPVVVIDYESIGARNMHTGALEMDWLTYVAPSFTAMLQQALPSEDDYKTDMTASPHSDLAIKWETATDVYFEEQCGPLTPRIYLKASQA